MLGRREVFESCFELRQAFDILLQRPDKLQLVTGELWPSTRILQEKESVVPGETEMENVEHLGQYVFEMTNAKVQQIRSERGLPALEPGVSLGRIDADVDFDGVSQEYEADDQVYEGSEEGFEAVEDA